MANPSLRSGTFHGCEYCQKRYYVAPSRTKKTRFCSKRCLDIFRTLSRKICLCCNKEFKPRLSSSQFCSRFCSSRGQKRYRGKKHYNWKGGITSFLQTLKNSSSWKLWRKTIFQRDHFTCQQCSKRGGKLHAHHLAYPLRKNLGIIFEPENGVTLCRTCHNNLHWKGG